jgi:acyl transferase domain-containing protein
LPSAPSVDSELDGFDSDPVVVCGFSVKFPGDADTADGLWKMIMERRCASTEFPADRTNPLGFYREKKRQNTVS